jgi:hypothetical protein
MGCDSIQRGLAGRSLSSRRTALVHGSHTPRSDDRVVPRRRYSGGPKRRDDGTTAPSIQRYTRRAKAPPPEAWSFLVLVLGPRGAGRAQSKRRRQSRLFRVGLTEKDCNEALQSESKDMRPLERSRQARSPSLLGPSSVFRGSVAELHVCHLAETARKPKVRRQARAP